MEYEEPDDDSGLHRSPLPPEDRLWRHPSEMRVPAARHRSRRSTWLVAGVSALGAGVLSTGLVILVATLLVDGDGPAVEREVVASSVTTSASADEDAVRTAARVRPAIAQVKPPGGGTGSAVLFRDDGHLLTNAHLVEGATTVTVALADGSTLPARVVGSDPETDIAVVKVDGDAFPVVTMGTTAALAVGQTAIAVGAPLRPAGGLSVAVGVISALHRDVRTPSGARTMYGMVETDTAVAPGASGGPLLDGAGNVVGITTAAAVGEEGTDGVGFAVPIDVARAVADQLLTRGRVTNVWMGIQGQDLDGATAARRKVDGGALVTDVKPGGPAERAGVLAGDVIVAVDGRPITSIGQLVVALRLQRPGSAVTLELARDQRRQLVAVTLAERPPNP